MQIQSLSGCVRGRKATKKLAMYSKQWSPGDTLRVFYRVFQNPDVLSYEYIAGQCWGYPVNDIKALGLKTTFIPALCKFDADGNPIGNPDILYRFSKLAPAFIKGRYEDEIRKATEKPGISEQMRREAIKAIDQKYDSKNNIEAIRPVIGRATPLIVVEALCVPMKDNKPVFDTLVVAMQPVSDNTADRLGAILTNPLYQPEAGEDWVEIEWSYPMKARKAESGQAAVPVGVAPEDRIKNKFPAEWERVKLAMGGMSTDSDMIVKRSTSAVSEPRIITALSTYITLNSTDLDNCSLNEDVLSGLESSIGVVHELNMDNVILDPKVKEILEKSKVDITPNAAELPPTETSIPEGLQQIANASSEAPSLESLLKEADANAEATEAFLNDIDLAAAMGD